MNSKEKTQANLELCESLLEEVEMAFSSLSQIALKASRLARQTGQFEHMQALQYEASGYPTTLSGKYSSEVWKLIKLAGRAKQYKNEESPNGFVERAKGDALDQMEIELEILEKRAREGSPNPSERKARMSDWREASTRLASRRLFLHTFLSNTYFELKFSSVAQDIFDRIRERVDESIGYVVPESVMKFSAVYENLASENNEDWSNAVHSCRRILQDTADSLYPAREDKIVESGSKPKTIKLGPDNYINRLIAYIEENSDSERFQHIVGSHLSYMGERLDAIFRAAQKGSHDVISSQDEADRYVVYTYLVVGDILKLKHGQATEIDGEHG